MVIMILLVLCTIGTFVISTAYGKAREIAYDAGKAKAYKDLGYK